MKYFLILSVLIITSIDLAYAQGEFVTYSPKIVTGYYVTQDGDELNKILRDDLALKPGLSKKKTQKIAALLKRSNPSVSDWDHLKANQKIYIEVPFDDITSKSILFAKAEERKPELKETQADEVESPAREELTAVAVSSETRHRYSVIASSSIGTFEEKSASTGNTISSKQFSPITLGASTSISNDSSQWSFLSSIYLSYVKSQNIPVVSSIQNRSLSIPLEVGLTAYAQKMIVPQLFSAYAGVDAEKFSTLNLIEIEENKTNILGVHEHTVVYGTLGTNLYLKVKGQPLNFRLSYSHSVISHVDSDMKAYSGFKTILYLQIPLNEKFFVSTFYKYHKMAGASDLTINRVGAGLGYSF